MDSLSSHLWKAENQGQYVYLTIDSPDAGILWDQFYLMFLAIHRSTSYQFLSHYSRVSYTHEGLCSKVYFTNDSPYQISQDSLLSRSNQGGGWTISARSQTINDIDTCSGIDVPSSVSLEEVWEFLGDFGKYELIKSVRGDTKANAITNPLLFSIHIIPKTSTDVPDIDNLINMALDIIGSQ
jgi:hypothetical protein